MNDKYLVLKREDITSCGHDKEISSITADINLYRHYEGKKSNRYVVINLDEPYVHEIIEIMRRYGHWDGDQG